MSLPTRQPTGQTAWPLIDLEGVEKSGKSVMALSLSRSSRVGRTFVFDLGDAVADEYARLGPYEIVELDGTYNDLDRKIRMACDEPAEDGKPNVIVLDSGTALWEVIKDWASTRARGSKKAKAILRDDPDAEIDVSMNYWNDAKDRWQRIIQRLRRWPGIAVVTVAGADVTKVQNGAPVAGQTEWSFQAEKTFRQVATAIVVLRRDPRTATLVGVRALDAPTDTKLPLGGIGEPADGWEGGTLDYLVFGVMAAGTSFGTSTIRTQVVGLSSGEAKTRLLGVLEDRGLGHDDAMAEARRLWGAWAWPDGHVPGGEDEVNPDQFADLIVSVISAPAADEFETGDSDPGVPPIDDGVTVSPPLDLGGAESPLDVRGSESPPDTPPDAGDDDSGADPGLWGHLPRAENRAADLLWLEAAPSEIVERVVPQIQEQPITDVVKGYEMTNRSIPANAAAPTRRAALAAYLVRREMELAAQVEQEQVS